MQLQQIVNEYKQSSWLRLCTLHNINKWDLIDYIKCVVFPSKYLIIPELAVHVRSCNTCNIQLNLGIYKGEFIVQRECNCAADNTHLMTAAKLQCVLTAEQSALAIELVNTAKRSTLPNTLEFWLNKGYTYTDAMQEVSNIQKARSLKSPSSKKGAKGYSIRTVEYWIKNGYTEAQAIDQVKHVQITNGLDFYLKKYGTDGHAMYITRLEKWLNSQGNKNMTKGRSKQSVELFEQLGIGYYGDNEKTVRGKTKVHRVDFLHNNKIIEFFGDYWHGNPMIYNDTAMIRKKLITDVWLHDASKISDLVENGYDVLIVWEHDYNNNANMILKKCKDFINEN